MAAPTKNQKIESLVKLVQKRSRGAGLPQPPQRTVLETLMYAALLENVSFDKAERAYTVLENYYIDWNEIRVCSLRELADTLSDLPHPEAAAERVRKALQGVFEKTYMFDLEDLRKKGKALAEHIAFLESIAAGTPFMIHYVAQVALDGYLIPLDEASLRIMRRLGLSQVSSDGTQEICIGLDRVILKKSSLTFAAQLHHFAAGYYDVPDSPELLSQLSAIDPEAVARSWGSPILSTAHAHEKDHGVASETPVEKPAAPKEIVQKENVKETTAAKPVKPIAQSAPSPAASASPHAPAKSSPKTAPAQKTGGAKPVKPAAVTKQPASKGSKTAASNKSKAQTPLKKSGSPKKGSKPIPVKKNVKVVGKKGLAKPSKKGQAASPSKALRKQKPK